MKIINNVEELDQRAIDKIATVLLNAYYKQNTRYPNQCEGIIINPILDTLGGVTATLYDGPGEGLTRRFSEDKLLQRDEKLPKHGNFT